MHPNFSNAYPRCVALGLKPVETGQPVRVGRSVEPGASHPGFDIDEVQKALKGRFDTFMAGVTSLFSCGHRICPETKCEAHCVYAKDLEAFLQAGK